MPQPVVLSIDVAPSGIKETRCKKGLGAEVYRGMDKQRDNATLFWDEVPPLVRRV